MLALEEQTSFHQKDQYSLIISWVQNLKSTETWKFKMAYLIIYTDITKHCEPYAKNFLKTPKIRVFPEPFHLIVC
jgi:hypothetical protein